MTKLTHEEIAFLRLVIYHKLRSWDSANTLESLMSREIDVETTKVEALCSTLTHADEAFGLSEADLVEAFELEEKGYGHLRAPNG